MGLTERSFQFAANLKSSSIFLCITSTFPYKKLRYEKLFIVCLIWIINLGWIISSLNISIGDLVFLLIISSNKKCNFYEYNTTMTGWNFKLFCVSDISAELCSWVKMPVKYFGGLNNIIWFGQVSVGLCKADVGASGGVAKLRSDVERSKYNLVSCALRRSSASFLASTSDKYHLWLTRWFRFPRF